MYIECQQCHANNHINTECINCHATLTHHVAHKKPLLAYLLKTVITGSYLSSLPYLLTNTILETPYFPKLPETPSPKSTQPLMRALKNFTPITTAYLSARRLLKKRKQNIQMPQRLTLSYSTPLPRFTPNSSDNFIIFSHDIKKDVLN